MNQQNQFDIFDQSNLFKTEYKNNLSGGKIPQAIESLKYLSGNHPEYAERIERLIELNTLISEHADNLNNLFKLYTSFEGDNSFSALKKDKNHIRKGFQKILSCMIKHDDYHFLDADTHPSWFLLKTEKYHQSIELLNNYLSNVGEHALLRQYLAFSYSKLKNSKTALLNFALALFNNPTACDADFIFGKCNQNLFDSIRKESPDDNQTWVRFTFQLWFEGRLNLDYPTPHFEKFLLSELPDRANNPDFIKNNVLFLNYLYVAEIYRTFNKNYQDMITIREKMKKLNSVLFDTYLKKIASA